MDTVEPTPVEALIEEAKKRYQHYDLPNRMPIASWSDGEIIEGLVEALEKADADRQAYLEVLSDMTSIDALTAAASSRLDELKGSFE